jgi:dienelactone hydrolase
MVLVAAQLARAAGPLVVVVSVKATAEEREAARELARYASKATGTDLLVTETPPSGAFSILVGRSVCPPEIRERLRRLRGDGYVIETLPGGSVALAGNGRDGTSFAVYRFLERWLGIRWLWPGENGDVVPKASSLRIEPMNVEQEPAYLWRDLGPGGALWGAMDKWTAESMLGVSEEHQRLERLWEKRNGLGGLRFFGGHAFGEILPPAKYGATHPEYFALVKGKRSSEAGDGKHGNQPCTSNPDVIRLTAQYVERFFDQHPEYDAFSISLNDGGGFCECDRCRRLDSGAAITDRIVTFANQVAEVVARKHPDKKLLLFAYGPYKQPPVRVKPDAHVIVQYTYHAAQAEGAQLQETSAWSGAAKELGVYEYFIQGNWPDLPRLMPEAIERSVRKLSEQGYRYYQTQAGDGYAINGLNYYLLARLLWNPSADARLLQADYVEKGFGRGAPAITRYFERLQNRWRELTGRPPAMDNATAEEYRQMAAAYPPVFRESCRRDLDEAYDRAQGQDRERVVFLQRGWHYVDLTFEAIEKTIPLFQAGWSFRPHVSAPANADKRMFRVALAAWEERERYVETLKQDFVVSYFWERYNAQNRSFVPLKQMQAYDSSPLFSDAQVKQWRTDIRKTLLVPDPLPALEPQTHGRFEPEPGVVAEKVTYTTEFGMRVPAILYLPKQRSGKIPGLIVVNGHGGDKYSWYAFYTGIEYARAGAAVLAYDPIGEGERNIQRKSGTRAHDKLQEPEEMGRRMGGLMMTDLMQAVSYLSERAEVDPQRIGAMGYSMGSFVASLTCAVETRLRACVAVGGGNLDGPMETWDHGKPMCQGIPYRSLMFLGDRPAVLYAMRASIGPTLVFNGTADTVVGIPPNGKQLLADLQRRTAALRGSSDGIFETGWEQGTSHRPYFVTRPVALWLERHLGFPNWSAAQIEAMPTTHISEWAAANSVPMDRLYADELREGGARTLGTGVPALSRSQLSVFSDEEWDKQKDRMIYETWIREARRQLVPLR